VNDVLQSDGMKTLSSDKPRAESVMKAQAWLSGINTLNHAASNSADADSAHRLLQSQLTTSLHPDDAQLAKPVVRCVLPTAVRPSVAQLKTQALTVTSQPLPRSTSNDTVAERMVVETTTSNALQSSAFVTDSGSNVILATPMKRVDSISASAGHPKTSVAHSAKVLSSTRRLPYENASAVSTRRDDSVVEDRHANQSDSHVGPLAQVQSVTERPGSEEAKLLETFPVSFNSAQRRTADVGGHSSLHSAALQNTAVGHRNINPEIPARSLTTAMTVSNRLSAAEHAVTASLPVNGSLKISNDGLFASRGNTRLNELWYRFSQDHTLCSPRPTDSSTTLSISSIEQTESGAIDSSAQHTQYQHLEQFITRRAAEDKSHDAKIIQQQLQQSSGGQLASSLSVSGSTADVYTSHHNLLSHSDHIPQQSAEPLHSSQPESRNPSKSDDAGKVSSLSTGTPVKHAWIVADETLPAVPEDTTLGSVMSDFTSVSSVDNTGTIVTHTTKRHLPDDPRLLRLQQKIAQQREKHRKVCRSEQRRKEHIIKMELALRERQKAMVQVTDSVKKTGADYRQSSSRLEMTTSTTTLTTIVTSTDSDMTLSSSPFQPTDNRTTSNSRLISAGDTSVSCSCHQAQCQIKTMPEINPKAKNVSPPKRHKSETSFKPKLQEVKYAKNKVAKSASTVLPHETSSRNQERNPLQKNVRRKINTSSTSHGPPVPESALRRNNAQGDRRRPSKISKSAAEDLLSKTGHANRILMEKNKHVTDECSTQSKAVQTTPRLRDNAVLYVTTAVQCPTVSTDVDEFATDSLPVMRKDQHFRSFSPASSVDSELMQNLKLKLLMKLSVRDSVRRELVFNCDKINIYFICSMAANLHTMFLKKCLLGFLL